MWTKLVSEPLIRELKSDEVYMASGRQPRKHFSHETTVATLRRCATKAFFLLLLVYASPLNGIPTNYSGRFSDVCRNL